MKRPLRLDNLDDVAYGPDGLVPVVAQDQITGAVLMLAWANRDALTHSLETGAMTYYSRSRQQLWTKGETSGHTQKLHGLSLDCDGDAVLALVTQEGAACHEGSATCWSEASQATWLGHLDAMAAARKAAPQGRYTDELLADAGLAASKIVEEAEEVAQVLRGLDNDDSLEHEAADLLYHLIVGLRTGGSDLEAALRELASRD